jgi:hypothetical protein
MQVRTARDGTGRPRGFVRPSPEGRGNNKKIKGG